MSKFLGWTKIFNFTFVQNIKKKSFILSTVIIAIILASCGIVALLFSANSNDSATKDASAIMNIKNAIIINDTDYSIENANTSSIEDIKDVNFDFKDAKKDVPEKNTEKYIKKLLEKKDDTIVIDIYEEDDTYYINSYILNTEKLNKEAAKEFAKHIQTLFQQSIITHIDLNPNQLIEIQTPSIVSSNEIGKSEDGIKELVATYFPYACGLILFMLIFFNSEGIATDVSTEKTSKLVESLLTSVKPYALITGKILANLSIALIQFFIWIGSVILGIVAGGKISKMYFPDYEVPTDMALSFIKSTFHKEALSIYAITLFILFIIIGFLFYAILAGLAGSMVSKPDELATCKMLYMLPIFIGYILLIAAPNVSETAQIVIDFIPFSAPMQMPGKVLIGACSMTYAIINLLVLLVFCILLILFTAKVYKGIIIYNGEKLSIKKVIGILKTKN